MPNLAINLITNPDSIGLSMDVVSLRNVIQISEASVTVVNIFKDRIAPPADINVYLETLHEGKFLNSAKSNWFFPNTEWYFSELWDRYLPLISLILCKTKNSYRIWKDRVGVARVLYCGFESRDMYNENDALTRNVYADSVTDCDKRFLHVAGKSLAKGTELIAKAWQWLPCPLTVVTCSTNQEEYQVTVRLCNTFNGLHNVKFLHSISDDELRYQYNSHRFVIAPSLMEGFGHCLREAMSAKCVILTTDAPPMNEINSIPRSLRIPVVRSVPRLLTEFHYVSPEGIAEAVGRAVRISPEDLDTIGGQSRQEWFDERDFFRKTMMEALNRWETYL